MTKKYRPCKCLYCGEDLDRNIEDWVEVGKRYAHSTCAAQEQKDIFTREKIHKIMKKKCGSAYSAVRINQQIKQYLSEGKTMLGIYSTIKYYFKVENGSASAANGAIAFVGWTYQKAKEYSEKKQRLKNQIEDTDKELIDKYINKQKEIPPPCPPRYKMQRPKRITYFQLD